MRQLSVQAIPVMVSKVFVENQPPNSGRIKEMIAKACVALAHE